MFDVRFYKKEKSVDEFTEMFVVELLEKDSEIGHIKFFTVEDIVNVEFSYIEGEYQGKGYSKELYKAFSKIYMDKFHADFPYIGRCFVDYKAYKTAKRMVDEGYLPKSTWNDAYIMRCF